MVEERKTLRQIFNSMTDDQKKTAYWIVGMSIEWKERHPRGTLTSFWKSISSYQPFCEGRYLDIYNTMTKEQRYTVTFYVKEVLENDEELFD